MSSPDLGQAERDAVAAVMQTPNLSMGQRILDFEAAMCDYTGARHAIGVNSGTSGLHLCVRAAGIEANDLVITTPFSFVASANVILFERAIPIFVDVDPLTGNIDPQSVAAAAADLAQGGSAAKRWLPRRGAEQAGRLRAILPVDVFGQPAELDPIQHTAQQHGLQIIEDSCEAIGAQYKGRQAGRLGDYGVFAFYPNKQMTTGEGGMVITDDDEAATFMRSLRNQGRAVGDTWLAHTHLGYNYRMDEMSAALGAVQVGRLDYMLNRREHVAQMYQAALQDIPELELPATADSVDRMSWFVYVIRVRPGIDRDRLAQDLKGVGIPARPYFIPIHLQPYMAKQFGFREGDFPVTEDLGQRGLAIPFSGVMTESQVGRVRDGLVACLSKQA
jgi:dTDP-4-amino-4,6-dideoxygalactose transaminase